MREAGALFVYNQTDFIQAALLPELDLSRLPVQQAPAMKASFGQLASATGAQTMQSLKVYFSTIREDMETRSKERVRFARFSPNGAQIISGSDECCVKLLDIPKARLNQNQKEVATEAQKYRRTLYGHTSPVMDGACSPCYDLVVSASLDSELRFYNTGAPEAEMLVHTESMGQPVQSVDFLSASQLLVGVTQPSRVLVYDLQKQQDYAIQLYGQTKGPLIKTRALNGLVGILRNDSFELVDPRTPITTFCLHDQYDDFHLMADRIMLCGQHTKGRVFDIRNPTKPCLPELEFQSACCGFSYDQYYAGLGGGNNSIKIYTYDGRSVTYSPTTQHMKKYNLLNIQGSPIEKTISFVYDKTFYVVDL